MKLNLSNKWYEEQATREGTQDFSAGSLEHQIEAGMVRESGPLYTVAGQDQSSPAFGLLIRLRRLERRLTIEALASLADVDLEELLAIDQGHPVPPNPRTVVQLALTLDLAPSSLSQLSGLTRSNENLRHRALQFAARSRSLDTLSDEEKELLADFVGYLRGGADQSA